MPDRTEVKGPLHREPGMGLRVNVHEDLAQDGYNFYFRQKRFDDRGAPIILSVDSFVIHEVREGEHMSPAFMLSGDEAQYLMEQLWRAGLRPQGIGGPGELNALRLHLSDMRKLVASHTGVPLGDLPIVGR